MKRQHRKAKANTPKAAWLTSSLCHHLPTCAPARAPAMAWVLRDLTQPDLRTTTQLRASSGSHVRREPTLQAAPRRGLSTAAVAGRDQPWPQAWADGKSKATLSRCPVALCWQRPSERIKASAGAAGRAEHVRAPCPLSRSWHRRQQPGRAPAPALGLGASGGSGSPARGGGCDTASLRRAPSTPASPPPLRRGGDSGLGRDKARSCPRPAAGLGRARLRAAPPAPPRGGPVLGGERMEREIKGGWGRGRNKKRRGREGGELGTARPEPAALGSWRSGLPRPGR